MFDVLQFYRDYNIDHIQAGHKHCRPGWVQIPCPFCSGNPGWHLGFCMNPSEEFYGAFVCWRCKGKSPIRVIKKLLGVTTPEAKHIFHKYKGRSLRPRSSRQPTDLPEVPTSIPLPSNTFPIQDPRAKGARLWLKNTRKFSPTELAEMWQICVTGPGTPDYPYRVIMPITYLGRIVSFQGRDYTGKQDIPYKACRKEVESVHHKNIVGGYDQAKATGADTVVLVEGFFDVFRLGPGACCLFGISYRRPQVRFVAEHFKRAVVLFDGGEVQARRQSQSICTELSQRGLEVHEILLEEGDPDEVFSTDPDAALHFMDKWLK